MIGRRGRRRCGRRRCGRIHPCLRVRGLPCLRVRGRVAPPMRSGRLRRWRRRRHCRSTATGEADDANCSDSKSTNEESCDDFPTTPRSILRWSIDQRRLRTVRSRAFALTPVIEMCSISCRLSREDNSGLCGAFPSRGDDGFSCSVSNSGCNHRGYWHGCTGHRRSHRGLAARRLSISAIT